MLVFFLQLTRCCAYGPNSIKRRVSKPLPVAKGKGVGVLRPPNCEKQYRGTNDILNVLWLQEPRGVVVFSPLLVTSVHSGLPWMMSITSPLLVHIGPRPLPSSCPRTLSGEGWCGGSSLVGFSSFASIFGARWTSVGGVYPVAPLVHTQGLDLPLRPTRRPIRTKTEIVDRSAEISRWRLL